MKTVEGIDTELIEVRLEGDECILLCQQDPDDDEDVISCMITEVPALIRAIASEAGLKVTVEE